uniref:Laminin EGF-like domain-containing protein n=1 Tax=Macrostomum lignano TaxID=282301 RepID=A0A1I8IYH5_9PLAT
MKTQWRLAAALLLLLSCSGLKLQEPMVNNLEQAATLEASATCGVGPDGESITEEFCKITGGIKHESESGIEMKDGSQCGKCNRFSHPASHVKNSNLGDSLSWMSPPLIRGDAFENVNFTITFKKVYQIDNIVMKTGESPRPAAFVVLKSLDGETYQPLMYFSTDCRRDFRMEPKTRADADDEVICMEKYKKLESFQDHSADINILLNKDRPSGQQPSDRLLEFLRVKSVRINFRRLYKFSTSMTPLNERKDDNQKKRYFYSVSLLKVSGHCYCNGLAGSCELDSLADDFKCRCIEGVEGDTCDRCAATHPQKPWKAGKPCEKCNCHGHSQTCIFNPEVARKRLSMDLDGIYEGGGVCANCSDNTTGLNCRSCIPGFFHPWGRAWNRTDSCVKCNCSTQISSGECKDGYGECLCKKNFTGLNCELCAAGYTNPPACEPCDCNPVGTVAGRCDSADGRCACRPTFGGDKCDTCADGFTGFPDCQKCNCSLNGATSEVCDPDSGSCDCKPGYTGPLCDQCDTGFFMYRGSCFSECGLGLGDRTV